MVSVGLKTHDPGTYKRPKLMAMPTPIFSGVRIWRFHRTFQGNRAKEKSMIADHTAHEVSCGISACLEERVY
jgi:hypothetical protein